MRYTDLLQALLDKKLVQTRPAPPIPERFPVGYKADRFCAFHQGASGHDTEDCFGLKYAVHRLTRDKQLPFTHQNPNIQTNPLSNHVSIVQDCPEGHLILDIQHGRTPLVPIHTNLCKLTLFEHDHAICEVCSIDPRGFQKVKDDIQGILSRRELTITRKDDEVWVIVPEFNIPKHVKVNFVNQRPVATLLVICVPGPMPYASEKAIPYNYNAMMLENRREVPIPFLPSVVNIAEDSRVLRNGRVIPALFPKKASTLITEQVQAKDLGATKDVGQASGAHTNADFEELLKLIKKSEYKVVDQLMQTPSKISVLSLLLNSEAHRNALMKVLDQAFVNYDVTVGQFDGIVGNITACNNLSFSDEELPEEGRNHNLALHISINCKTNALSNVLVDIGLSLNVMAKTTYDQLSYQGTPLRRSEVVVKDFDGSRKNVHGAVDLPITIGPHVFQITFQVMDIQAAYSCLLGRPWIHEAGAITSTLHKKLKFVKNGKLVTVGGEQAMLVSHLSSFSFIGADVEDGTCFQGLYVEDEGTKKSGISISSFKDA